MIANLQSLLNIWFLVFTFEHCFMTFGSFKPFLWSLSLMLNGRLDFPIYFMSQEYESVDDATASARDFIVNQ